MNAQNPSIPLDMPAFCFVQYIHYYYFFPIPFFLEHDLFPPVSVVLEMFVLAQVQPRVKLLFERFSIFLQKVFDVLCCRRALKLAAVCSVC